MCKVIPQSVIYHLFPQFAVVYNWHVAFDLNHRCGILLEYMSAYKGRPSLIPSRSCTSQTAEGDELKIEM